MPPESPNDFFLTEGGHRAYRYIRPTEPPRPLLRPTPPAEPYPVDALGLVLAEAVRAVEAMTQAPLALCAQSVLAAASLATQAHANVLLPTSQHRPVSLALLSLGVSGERKSTVDGLALEAAHDHERALERQYRDDMQGYENDHAAWQHARGGIKKKGGREDIREALASVGTEPSPPRKPIILASEPTIEGLLKLFADGRPSMGIVSAEGSTFIGGHGMSEEARLRTAGTLSRLWDDGQADRVRATDGAVKLYGRRLTVHLATQPGNGLAWLESADLRDQGLFSRLLIVAPDSKIGERFITAETKAAAIDARPKLERFRERCAELHRTTPGVEELEPRLLPFSDAAAEYHEKFQNDTEAKMKAGAEYGDITAFANKAPEHVARIAAVRTIFENPDAVAIEAEAVIGAITAVHHYLGEAGRLASLAGVGEELSRAQAMLAYLEAQGREVFHLAELYQKGPAATRTAAAARRTMNILQDHGHVIAIEGGELLEGTHRREVWRMVHGI
jgi:hypothetical protein